jgi:cytochrome P450
MGFGNSLFNLFNGGAVKGLAGIPGPEPTWPMGNVGLLSGQNSWEVFAGLEEHGPVAVFWILGSPMVVVTDPDLVRDVLVDNRDAYFKIAPGPALTPVGGADFVFFINGDAHTKTRAAHPLCRPDVFEGWYPAVLPGLRDYLGGLVADMVQADGALDFLPAIRELTFRIFGQLAVGDPLDSSYDNFKIVGDKGNARLTNPLALKMPVGGAFKTARIAWLGAIEAQVKAGRGEGTEDRHDLAATFSRICPHIPADVLALEVSNIHYGGAISTCSTLMGTLWELSRHADTQAALRTEVDALPTDCSFEQLDALPLLDSVIRETARLWCPVPMYQRNVLREKAATLGGHSIPPGTELLITNWAIQRSATTYDKPTEWLPARWTDELKAEHPYGSTHLLPFGAGPRECLGREFALLCLKAAVVEFVRAADLSIDDSGYKPDFYYGVLSPDGLQATVAARS